MVCQCPIRFFDKILNIVLNRVFYVAVFQREELVGNFILTIILSTLCNISMSIAFTLEVTDVFLLHFGSSIAQLYLTMADFCLSTANAISIL